MQWIYDLSSPPLSRTNSMKSLSGVLMKQNSGGDWSDTKSDTQSMSAMGGGAPPSYSAWRRAIALVLACLAIAASGTILSFTSFAPDFKKEFRLSQQAVELIGSAGMFGACLGYPCGLVHERIGNTNSYVLALLLCGVSSSVLFISQYCRDFFHTAWPLLAILWVIYGFGTVFSCLVSYHVSMANHHPRHRGLIIGINASFFFVGPSLFSFLYTTYFAGLPVGDFYLCLAIVTICINGMAIAFVRVIPREDDVTKQEDEDISANIVTCIEGEEEQDEVKDTWCQKLGVWQCISPSFQLLLWALFFGATVQFMYIINIGTFIYSYEIPGLGAYMAIISPLCASVATLSSGLLSDKTMQCTSRLTYVLFGTVIQMLAFVVSSGWGDNEYIFIITSSVVYSCNGMYWSLVPTLVSEYFGTKHFTRNWGLILMNNALLSLGTCSVFAGLYDIEASKFNNACFGLPCFRNSYMLGAFMSLLSTLLFVALRFVESKQRTTSLM